MPFLILLSTCAIKAQTVLEPGDLAVVGVNANNRDCGGENGEDLISFVCFKDILPNTEINLTDNGWERENANTWGNSEAFISAVRSGDTIPAGTVITFRLPGIGGRYSAAAPDTSWTFTRLNTLANNVNLNNGGDQIFFLQGGTWFDGTSVGFSGFSHDATYTGGRLLFGFNTRTAWNSFGSDSQNSGLPTEIANCFNMAPSGAATDYLSYAGPMDATTQLEWISRISDPQNWQSFPDCNAYMMPTGSIPLAPSGISISCAVCESCGPTEEGIIFNLPEVGGPFIVSYQVGQDTFTSTLVENGDTVQVQVDTSTQFEIISVSDAQNCPTFSNFEGGFRTSIIASPSANSVGSLEACGDVNLEAIFNLSALDTLINSDTVNNINWYSNANQIQAINDPTSFTSSSDTVFAVVEADACFSDTIDVGLIVNDPPSLNFSIDGSPCDSNCRSLDLNLLGNAPFRLIYDIQLANDTLRNTFESTTSSLSLILCKDDFPNSNGAWDIMLIELQDANCSQELMELIPIFNSGPVITDLNLVLCEEESIIVNETVFDIRRPIGTEVFPGAAQNGCDSIVNVALVFTEPVLGDIGGAANICPGESTPLIFDLQGGTSYSLQISDGSNTPIFLENVMDGDSFLVNPTTTTTYTLVEVSATGTNCLDQSGSRVTITVNESTISINPTTNFGGFPLSCNESSDANLAGIVSGNYGPYALRWNTGDSTQSLNNIAAGTYTLSVIDKDGCQTEASFEVVAPDPIIVDLSLDSSFCVEDPANIVFQSISGGVGPFEYSLDGTFFQPIANLPFSVNDIAPGNYTLNVQDVNDCRITESISLGDPEGITITLGEDRSIELGDSVRIRANTSFTPQNIQWTNTEEVQFLDELSFFAQPNITTTYGIRIENENGCVIEDFITIFVEQNEGFYAPSGFSPNADGINDQFTLYGGINIQQFNYLRVYNRWGRLVFEVLDLAPNDEFRGWDGKVRNEFAPIDTYIFVAEMQLQNGKKRVVSDEFALIR